MDDGKIKVLILEDDFFLSRLFRRVMHKKTDLDIYTVQTIEAARKHLHEQTFDLFLCDLKVGRENALNLLVEEEDYLTSTNVCIVSAWSRYEFATSLLGVHDFLLKPVSNQQILALIDSLTQRPAV